MKRTKTLSTELTKILIVAVVVMSPITSLFAQSADPYLQMGKVQAIAYLEKNNFNAHPGNLQSYAIHAKADAVIAMLASGADPNYSGSLPQSPLFMASSMACISKSGNLNDQLRTMDALITSGADVNAGWEGLSILTMSAQQCPAVIVKRLLKAGAKIDARSPQGFTPLSMALIVGNVESATALVEAGARLSAALAAKLVEDADDINPEIKALITRATAKK